MGSSTRPMKTVLCLLWLWRSFLTLLIIFSINQLSRFHKAQDDDIKFLLFLNRQAKTWSYSVFYRIRQIILTNMKAGTGELTFLLEIADINGLKINYKSSCPLFFCRSTNRLIVSALKITLIMSLGCHHGCPGLDLRGWGEGLRKDAFDCFKCGILHFWSLTQTSQ